MCDVYFLEGAGTHVAVIDARTEGGPAIWPLPWRTWCHEHEQAEEWYTLREARREARSPETWCLRCNELDAADEDEGVELGTNCDDGEAEYVLNNGFLHHRRCGARGCPGIDR